MRWNAFYIVLFLIISARVSAQYYETGQDPASVRWKQIKSEHFTVIFPESFASEGQDYVKALESAASNLLKLYPEKKFRIPVVIHNYSSNSNGYVAWAPKRMELYPLPDQNSIPLDPVDQLAIHEMTHVRQMLALNSGFTKGASWLLGEQVIGAVSVLLPLWYLEGDAVFAESALSESGRGRTPSFQKELKAMSFEKGKLFGYDKMINGSYRDYIPDHYQLGYQIAAWGRNKYGNDIWNQALSKTGREPFTVNPVNISLAVKGTSKKKLFKEAFDSLGAIWSDEIRSSGKKEYSILNPPKKERFINYHSPVPAGRDSIIAIKTSLSSVPTIVLIRPSEKTVQKIHVPGQVYPFYISYGDNKVVWVELQYDPRWENRSYSIIRLLNLRTGNVSRLSSRTRYLAASISPDGKTIAAIETTIDNKSSLVFLDTEGKLIRSIKAPEGANLQRPQWSSDSRAVTVISLNVQGEAILSISPEKGEWNSLTGYGRDDIQSSTLRNDSLFFVSSSTGTDNIILKTPAGGYVTLTNSMFGIKDVSLNGGKMIFSDYSSSGNNISTIAIGEYTAPARNNESKSFLINRFDYSTNKDYISTDSSVYTSAPYRKWNHLFRFHSWMPFWADVEEIRSDPTAIRPGITLMSQNSLSSLTSIIGYEYSEDKQNLFHTSLKWQGWYPVFETELNYGDRPFISKAGNTVGDPSEVKKGVSFINTVSVPLSFTTGRFFQYIKPSLALDYRNDYIYVKENQAYDYGQYVATARLYFSNYYRYAWRDINPRWAQSFDLTYTDAPWDKNIYGTSLAFRSTLFFPGFFRNHSIRFRYENEKQDPVKFMYGNRVSLPRGYSDIRSRERELISGDYVLPLLYPDFNLASFFYLTRIRTSLFYDFEKAFGNTYYTVNSSGNPQQVYHGYEEIFRSYGFELLGDFYLLRLPFQISGGIQTSWTDNSSKPVVKAMFTIDLFGMSIGRKHHSPI